MKVRIIAVLLVSLAVTAAAYADFKADVVVRQGGTTTNGKLLSKGDKSRIEFPNAIIIKRPDKGVSWMISTQTKTYVEMPEKQAGRRTTFYESIPGVKRLGAETVSGYPCSKYQIVMQGKVSATTTVWVSDKLNQELKIISQSPAGQMTMEVQNIKRTFLFGKTFEIPKGYTKKATPHR